MANPGLTACIYVDEQSKTTNFLRTLSGWYEQLGIPCESSAKEVRLFNGATIRGFTANSTRANKFSGAGRSTTAHLIYYSEFAFYNRAEEMFAASTSSAVPSAKIIVESTSTGKEALFYDLWRSPGWSKRFYGVEDHEAYQSDSEISDAAFAFYCSIGFTSRPHAAWFDEKINSIFGGDRKLALLEYPIVEEDAWASIDGRFIDTDPAVIDYETCQVPFLHVFHPPHYGGRYVIGYDPSAGVGMDNASIAVICRYTGRLEACWVSNKMDADTQVTVLKQIWDYYSNPPRDEIQPSKQHTEVILVENNGIGNGIAPFIKKLGLPVHEFSTRGGSKEDYSKYLNFLSVKRGIESGLLKGDGQLLKEARALVRDDEGKFSGPDDLIASIGFCLTYNYRNPSRAPVAAVSPHTHFSMDRLLGIGGKRRNN